MVRGQMESMDEMIDDGRRGKQSVRPSWLSCPPKRQRKGVQRWRAKGRTQCATTSISDVAAYPGELRTGKGTRVRKPRSVAGKENGMGAKAERKGWQVAYLLRELVGCEQSNRQCVRRCLRGMKWTRVNGFALWCTHQARRRPTAACARWPSLSGEEQSWRRSRRWRRRCCRRRR